MKCWTSPPHRESPAGAKKIKKILLPSPKNCKQCGFFSLFISSRKERRLTAKRRAREFKPLYAEPHAFFFFLLKQTKKKKKFSCDRLRLEMFENEEGLRYILKKSICRSPALHYHMLHPLAGRGAVLNSV